MNASRVAAAAPEKPEGGHALLLDNISFEGGKRVLGPFSIHVGCGEIVGLLGPSAAGKTSLLRLVAGELKPLAGSVLTYQTNITGHSVQGRQEIGVFVCLHDRRLLRANRSMLATVAAAIDRQPKVLLIDEPFRELEVALGRQALISMLRTCRDAGVGVLITDHNIREALRLVDRAYLMFDGKIEVEGTPDFLLS